MKNPFGFIVKLFASGSFLIAISVFSLTILTLLFVKAQSIELQTSIIVLVGLIMGAALYGISFNSSTRKETKAFSEEMDQNLKMLEMYSKMLEKKDEVEDYTSLEPGRPAKYR